MSFEEEHSSFEEEHPHYRGLRIIRSSSSSLKVMNLLTKETNEFFIPEAKKAQLAYPCNAVSLDTHLYSVNLLSGTSFKKELPRKVLTWNVCDNGRIIILYYYVGWYKIKMFDSMDLELINETTLDERRIDFDIKGSCSYVKGTEVVFIIYETERVFGCYLFWSRHFSEYWGIPEGVSVREFIATKSSMYLITADKVLIKSHGPNWNVLIDDARMDTIQRRFDHDTKHRDYKALGHCPVYRHCSQKGLNKPVQYLVYLDSNGEQKYVSI